MGSKYRKGDYVAFMAKQPAVHINRMFGYNDLTADDFKKTEHEGLIQAVILDNMYVITTTRPLEGFRCLVNEKDILHIVDRKEETDNHKLRELGSHE